jgi:hypothetical protein
MGLKKIERLDTIPRFEGISCADTVYVIDQEEAFGDATVLFKVMSTMPSRRMPVYTLMPQQNGFARLKVPDGRPLLQIWDTPAPVDLQRCPILPERIATTRFATIDLDAVIGLTFLIFNNKIIAIHSHTKRAVSAALTVDRLRGEYSESMIVWLYVPLPQGDNLVGFGHLAVERADGSLMPVHRPPFSPVFLVRVRTP